MGSVNISTADYIKFADSTFYTDRGAPSVMSGSGPVAFGFLGASAGNISVNESDNSFGVPVSFSIIGGDITFNDHIPSHGFTCWGAINLVSTKSAGEVDFSGTHPVLHGFAGLGDITVDGPALSSGMDVFIRGNDIHINNSSIQSEHQSIALSADSQLHTVNCSLEANYGTIEVNAPVIQVAGVVVASLADAVHAKGADLKSPQP